MLKLTILFLLLVGVKLSAQESEPTYTFEKTKVFYTISQDLGTRPDELMVTRGQFHLWPHPLLGQLRGITVDPEYDGLGHLRKGGDVLIERGEGRYLIPVAMSGYQILISEMGEIIPIKTLLDTSRFLKTKWSLVNIDPSNNYRAVLAREEGETWPTDVHLIRSADGFEVSIHLTEFQRWRLRGAKVRGNDLGLTERGTTVNLTTEDHDTVIVSFDQTSFKDPDPHPNVLEILNSTRYRVNFGSPLRGKALQQNAEVRDLNDSSDRTIERYFRLLPIVFTEKPQPKVMITDPGIRGGIVRHILLDVLDLEGHEYLVLPLMRYSESILVDFFKSLAHVERQEIQTYDSLRSHLADSPEFEDLYSILIERILQELPPSPRAPQFDYLAAIKVIRLARRLRSSNLEVERILSGYLKVLGDARNANEKSLRSEIFKERVYKSPDTSEIVLAIVKGDWTTSELRDLLQFYSAKNKSDNFDFESVNVGGHTLSVSLRSPVLHAIFFRALENFAEPHHTADSREEVLTLLHDIKASSLDRGEREEMAASLEKTLKTVCGRDFAAQAQHSRTTSQGLGSH